MVDALPSGGSVRKDVLVRIQSRAPNNPYKLLIYKGCLFLSGLTFYLKMLKDISSLHQEKIKFYKQILLKSPEYKM